MVAVAAQRALEQLKGVLVAQRLVENDVVELGLLAGELELYERRTAAHGTIVRLATNHVMLAVDEPKERITTPSTMFMSLVKQIYCTLRADYAKKKTRLENDPSH